MTNFMIVRFTLVVYVSHEVNVLVTDIILNFTSQEHLIFTSLHIGSRLFELFSKEVRVKKQPGMPLKLKLTLSWPTCWILCKYKGAGAPLLNRATEGKRCRESPDLLAICAINTARDFDEQILPTEALIVFRRHLKVIYIILYILTYFCLAQTKLV